MGYACPVCDDPQADAEHLANHLAFTAMLRGAGHEAWLDEHVDGWADLAPEELAERVSDYADEKEYPQVFEDTTGGHESGRGHDHGAGGHEQGGAGHGHGGQSVDAVENAAPGGVADLDEVEGDQEDVLAEARELTRQRRENAAADAGANDGDGDVTDGADEANGDAADEGDAADGDATDGDAARDEGEETGSS